MLVLLDTMSYRLLGTKNWSQHNFKRVTSPTSVATKLNAITTINKVPELVGQMGDGRRTYTLFCVNNLTVPELRMNNTKCLVGAGNLKRALYLLYFNYLFPIGFSSTIFSTNRPQSTIPASTQSVSKESVSKKQKNFYKIKFAELIQSELLAKHFKI